MSSADGRRCTLTEDELHALMPQLEALHGCFHPCFCRAEGRARSQQDLSGLLRPMERKHVEHSAEPVDAPPRTLQALVRAAPWDAAGCITERQR